MTTVLEKGNISIHTENIFPIIKKWLYSDHEIFLRELVSNAVDAIQKLKMVSHSGEYAGDLGEPEIVITLDKEAGTLAISDTGIGMTADEVKKYINQVAFSSAEEFVEKYKASSDQQIIGHFGLGFYSSFMVAKRVEIDTLSYQVGNPAVHWSCDGSTEFELSDSDRTTRGTTITLHLMDEEKEYLEPYRVRSLITKYCDFMPFPIKLDVKEAPQEAEPQEGETETAPEVKAPEQINRQKAPWKEAPSSLSKEDYLEFYRYLYPFQEEPLLWVHLNTDYPFVVNGILYFPKLKPDVDVTKGQIKLFCNQVFVSDNCEEVIPKFLLPLRGVIDSADIPLNVSRSFLQNDRTVRRIADYIAKKVGDRLKELYRDDRDQYIRSWQDLGTFVKFGSMNDDKFKKQVEDILIYRTTNVGEEKAEGRGQKAEGETPKVEVQSAEGDVWQDVSSPSSPTPNPQSPTPNPAYTTLKEYLERNKTRHENRVYYCTDEVTQATYVELHKQQGLEVLFMDSFIDTHFISFLEREFSEVKFSRVDADLDETLIDKEKEAEIVDPTTNKTRSETIKELFEKSLNKPKVTIRTEALKASDDAPPAVVLLPENLRRMREMMALMQQQSVEFPDEHVLLVNTAHPLIQNLANISKGAVVQTGGQSPSGELADLICHHVYDLALMAQKGFDADGMKAFIDRSNQVLTRLAERATA
ncbi:MAG: molecular chaperone HtpG [Leptolyngbyaceae cyanobacterium bins.302]|nr:molecular chaperone HtpG [Leptolyngbyaceae cyanobacterium bins.302]